MDDSIQNSRPIEFHGTGVKKGNPAKINIHHYTYVNRSMAYIIFSCCSGIFSSGD